MDRRENILRAIRFERPERIPLRFAISEACWQHYDQAALIDLKASHPLLFPGFKPPALPYRPRLAPWQRADAPCTDSWGCVWRTAEDGLTGGVIEHPLADWARLDDYSPPDPARQWGWGERDWPAYLERLRSQRRRGELVRDGLRHGHTFLTLSYIRGYENLMFDMADGEPRLATLIEMVESFNLAHVRMLLDAGVEVMGYPEDLGMQQGPMLSPAHFARYVRPSYDRLMAPARAAGVLIHMHSDGDIRALTDQILACGVDALNLQDLVNGVGWIAAALKGRVCIDLDVDRQRVTRFGTPADIDALIRDEAAALGSPEGGLMLNFGMYPGIPLENAAAVMDAMERYAGHHAG